MSIFAAYESGKTVGRVGASSTGRTSFGATSSIFISSFSSPMGKSSTSGYMGPRSAAGGFDHSGGRGGGGIFGSSEQSQPTPGAPPPPATRCPPLDEHSSGFRKSILEQRTVDFRDQRTVDFRLEPQSEMPTPTQAAAMPPEAGSALPAEPFPPSPANASRRASQVQAPALVEMTGNQAEDMKKLLEQLKGLEATPSPGARANRMSIMAGNDEVPMSAYDDLRDTTQKLVELMNKSPNGKSPGATLHTGELDAQEDDGTTRIHEEAVRDKMRDLSRAK
uniref:Uncharacterized protein n=1 Tax=Pyrodinium bahamense TaxID=73915 RepID=A0A7S0BCU0_9DINO|mmetsp:Transcript_8937/g.24799  ORF Transcript_8937/g.24799 Transcript_8937/m.24799 type:complete len:278 (+) Transcript_8937:70-903(+)